MNDQPSFFIHLYFLLIVPMAVIACYDSISMKVYKDYRAYLVSLIGNYNRIINYMIYQSDWACPNSVQQ